MPTTDEVRAIPLFSTLVRTALETSVPGIFACGDVRPSPVKRVASAVAEGSMAIALVHQYMARAAERAVAVR